MILALRFWAPKVPGALVLVVGGLLASHLCSIWPGEMSRWSVPVPSGLPAPQLPSLDIVLSERS